jgi:hypothetical protein
MLSNSQDYCHAEDIDVSERAYRLCVRRPPMWLEVVLAGIFLLVAFGVWEVATPQGGYRDYSRTGSISAASDNFRCSPYHDDRGAC